MRNPAQIQARAEKVAAERAALERELAEWHQAHKEDPNVWDGSVATEVPPRRLLVIYSVRVDAELIERLRVLAEFYGCSTSDVARRLLANAWLPAVQMNRA